MCMFDLQQTGLKGRNLTYNLINDLFHECCLGDKNRMANCKYELNKRMSKTLWYTLNA